LIVVAPEEAAPRARYDEPAHTPPPSDRFAPEPLPVKDVEVPANPESG
jgi:hypothetical protein